MSLFQKQLHNANANPGLYTEFTLAALRSGSKQVSDGQARSGFRVLIPDHSDLFKPTSKATGERFKISLTTTSQEHQAGFSPIIMLFPLALKPLTISWDLTGITGGARLHKLLPRTDNFHFSKQHR